MSGLEALATLGLACSIFQVISFGHETLGVLKRVYKTGELEPSRNLYAEELKQAADNIHTFDISKPARKSEQQLFDNARKCNEVAEALQEELLFLLRHVKQGSLKATLKTAVKVGWRKRRLERLEKDLAAAEKLMQTSLLSDIWLVVCIFMSVIIASC